MSDYTKMQWVSCPHLTLFCLILCRKNRTLYSWGYLIHKNFNSMTKRLAKNDVIWSLKSNQFELASTTPHLIIFVLYHILPGKDCIFHYNTYARVSYAEQANSCSIHEFLYVFGAVLDNQTLYYLNHMVFNE